MIFSANPFLCALVCIGKGMLSGLCAGLTYRCVAKHAKSLVGVYLAALLAAIVAPVVNSGVFCLGMLLFFQDTLRFWAAGSELFNYIIFGLTGVNFLIELGVNLVLSPAISTILKSVKKMLA